MKKMKFSENQIVNILKEAEAGVSLEELVRQHGFSKASFYYKWKAKYSGMSASDLKRLKELGKQLGVITATSRRSFEHDLELHKIPKDLLDYTQTEDDTSFHKPDPKVFELVLVWLKKQNLRPEAVLYIGDGLHDMKAALGAGFNFLGVQTGLISADEFNAAKAKSIKDLHELL